MWHLKSPNGNMSFIVKQNVNGGLNYQVERDGVIVLENSPLGLESDIEAFTSDLVFMDAHYSVVDETYSLPAGKKAVYYNCCNELCLTFTKGEVAFAIKMRAYDDGIAFRYEISHSKTVDIRIIRETTGFCVGKTFEDLWLQDWVKSYEGTYNLRIWDHTLAHQHFGMPGLLHDRAQNIWMMISEAGVLTINGNYCSCHLVGTAEHRFDIGFAPEEKGQPIISTMPFTSPWRFVILTDSLNELVNSTLNYNLNPPSMLSNVTWIRPARALWAWWEYENASQLYSESKAYIDIAAAMGFEAVTLDCPWDASCVKALCDYAHSKHVQIWIWTGMQQLSTYEKAIQRIPLWASWGVDGLKVDFFENDSGYTMQQYKMIAEIMTENKLMINFHGATKPMGEGRTWPNYMTSEGILGLEHYKWSDLPNATHNCTVPFTRNVLGPMDYTPTGFSNSNRNTSMAHQMALPVVFESGVTHYALSLYYLEAWQGTDFLRRTKSKYDGVKVLSGFPGDHAAIMRYAGDEYLVGIINTYKRRFVLSFDFLPEGDYEAEIYEDDSKGESINVRRLAVNRHTTLNLDLVENGGAGLYITKHIGELPGGVLSGYMSGHRTVYPAWDAKPRRGSEPVSWDNQQRGMLLNAGAEFTIDVPNEKLYTLRFFYSAELDWKLSACAGEQRVTCKMPKSGHYKTFITHQIVMYLKAGLQTLQIDRVEGGVPALKKMHLVDNDPQKTLLFGAQLAKLTGDAELVQVEEGIFEAVGLGKDAEMIYENIELMHDGTYILRVNYCGGEARDISFEANDTERVDTYLHPTSGWGFPSWDKPEGKEVLILLQAGKNRIRLFNKNGSMSHIRGIELTLENENKTDRKSD